MRYITRLTRFFENPMGATLLVLLLLLSAGCSGQSGSDSQSGQVIIQPTGSVLAAAALSKTATLDIVGTPLTGILMNPTNDNKFEATVPGVPVGTWTFRITYRDQNGNVTAKASGVATVTANRTTEVSLTLDSFDFFAATAVAAGSAHSCARLADGTVWCWGANEFGQLGRGGDPTRFEKSPKEVVQLSVTTAIAAGSDHSCAVLDDELKSVWCWGDNSSKQLGIPSSNPPLLSSTPKKVNLNRVKDAAAGNNYSCAVLDDELKSVWCWGATITNPAKVANLNNVTAVATGGLGTGIFGDLNYGCAVSNGTVWCWGANSAGTTAPVQVFISNERALTGVTAIAAGSDHSCARLADETVWCWTVNSLNPFKVLPAMQIFASNGTPLSGVTTVAASNDTSFSHSCAVLNGGPNGTVWCWGDNSRGQLGNGTKTNSESPVQVLLTLNGRALTGVIAIAAGSEHSCAILHNGTVSCWGGNGSSQLGDGKSTDSSIPVAVQGLND